MSTAEDIRNSTTRGNEPRGRGNRQSQNVPTQSGPTRGSNDEQGQSSEPLQLMCEKYIEEPLGFVEDMPPGFGEDKSSKPGEERSRYSLSRQQLQRLVDSIDERISELEPKIAWKVEDRKFIISFSDRQVAIGKRQGSLAAQTLYLNAMCRLLDHDADLLARSRGGDDRVQRQLAAWLRVAIEKREVHLDITEKRRRLAMLEFKWAQMGNGKSLEMEYPGCCLNVWVRVALKEEEEQAIKEYHENIPVLLLGEKVWNVEILSLVKLDLEWCNNFHKGTKDQEGSCKHDMMVSTFLLNTEVAEFMNSNSTDSQGLLVLGAELRTPKLPGSSLSGLMWELVQLLQKRPNNAVLVHAMGLRDTISPEINSTKCEYLRGLVGCLRSICAQLTRWCIDQGLQVDWKKLYATVDLDETMGNSIEGLCRLFRAVLGAIAAAGAQNKQRYVVTVLIDDIHILETDEKFRMMVFFFRAICDESFFGDLGTWMTFNCCTQESLDYWRPLTLWNGLYSSQDRCLMWGITYLWQLLNDPKKLIGGPSLSHQPKFAVGLTRVSPLLIQQPNIMVTSKRSPRQL